MSCFFSEPRVLGTYGTEPVSFASNRDPKPAFHEGAARGALEDQVGGLQAPPRSTALRSKVDRRLRYLPYGTEPVFFWRKASTFGRVTFFYTLNAICAKGYPQGVQPPDEPETHRRTETETSACSSVSRADDGADEAEEFRSTRAKAISVAKERVQAQSAARSRAAAKSRVEVAPAAAEPTGKASAGTAAFTERPSVLGTVSGCLTRAEFRSASYGVEGKEMEEVDEAESDDDSDSSVGGMQLEARSSPGSEAAGDQSHRHDVRVSGVRRSGRNRRQTAAGSGVAEPGLGC